MSHIVINSLNRDISSLDRDISVRESGRLDVLRASAICDIYELKHQQRHAWVRLFLESMTDIPKSLWGRQVVVVVDEAHMFCPEKGKGESEAYGAMVDLCTRGRKRGHCAIFATQRLGQLSKDASSQLQNRLIGPTFEDINRKRAAEVLGVLKSEEREFFKQIQLLEPGNFWALGRAISKERILVHVGDVQTTHPEAGSSKHAEEPPPAPEAIAKLLPKLADLPKAAEEHAKTVTELKQEIRSLKGQLREQPAKTETKEVRVGDPRAVQKAVQMLKVAADRQIAERDRAVTHLVKGIKAAMDVLRAAAERAAQMKLPPFELPKILAGEIHRKEDVSPKHRVEETRPPRLSELSSRPEASHAENAGELSRSHRAILKAIAEFEAIGRTQISKSWIAARAGASYTSSTYTNNLGFLRSNGFITYPGPDLAALTDKGRDAAGAIEPPQTSQEMLESCLNLLSDSQQKILRALYESYPEPLDKNQLATNVGASAGSSTYSNNLGALRSAGMVEYPAPGKARCADWLFLE